MMAVKYQIIGVLAPTRTVIIPELAKEIGLNESIILNQIIWWIQQSNTDEIDGDYWTYQSVRKMQKEAFPYWGVATIQRTIEALVEAGYIKTGQHNKRKGDNTRWFALVPEKLRELKSVELREIVVEPTRKAVPKRNTSFQNGTPPNQNGTTLPETTTETTQKDIAPNGAATKKSKGRQNGRVTPEPMSYAERSGKTEAELEAERRAVLDKETVKAQENEAVQVLTEAWIRANNAVSSNQYSRTGFRKILRDLHRQGITPDDLSAFIHERKREEFWQNKAVSPSHIADNILSWKSKPNGAKSVSTAPLQNIDLTPEELAQHEQYKVFDEHGMFVGIGEAGERELARRKGLKS